MTPLTAWDPVEEVYNIIKGLQVVNCFLLALHINLGETLNPIFLIFVFPTKFILLY